MCRESRCFLVDTELDCRVREAHEDFIEVEYLKRAQYNFSDAVIGQPADVNTLVGTRSRVVGKVWEQTRDLAVDALG